jgi:hypothetical protein
MRMDTEALIGEPARAASVGGAGIELRNATNVACSEQAQLLTRGRPFIAAFPRVVTHAQAVSRDLRALYDAGFELGEIRESYKRSLPSSFGLRPE